VMPQPLNDFERWNLLLWLAEDVGIDEIVHKRALRSDSRRWDGGLNQPLCGQASR
jgi:hypothetical protein